MPTSVSVTSLWVVHSQDSILVTQSNIANTYEQLGRFDEAIRMRRDVYSGHLKLFGKEHQRTLMAANNYALSLLDLRRFEEANSLMLKTMPVARRILGEGHIVTLRMRWNYAMALYLNTDATLDDVREAVTTLEDMAPIARRVFGGAYPFTSSIERTLRDARAALRAREG